MRRRWAAALLTALCVAQVGGRAWAQQSPQSPATQGQAVGRDAARPSAVNPPPPASPDVVARDPSGQRATVRAIHLNEPLRVDGKLDEALYQEKAIDGFLQSVPDEGAPVTERTEAWVAYDADNLYIACRCWDSEPPEHWVANELRRDTNQLRQNDMFGALLDTYHDKRNGFNFYTNPLGAQADQVITDEGNPNVDWNPVWFVRTGRFEGGWTVEMAIPFKSVRYNSGVSQTWGLQLRRAIRRKNEWAHLTAVPASTNGSSGIFRVSAAGDLVDLDLPAASRNVELKPYGITKLTTDHARIPAVVNDPSADAGIDAKFGISANVTADVTVNTDFAQVEVDEQQVNLTRFALVFPEKRDFFLEGRGIFDFARSGGTGGGGGGGGGGASGPAATTPQVFYTRRIGLNRGREIPIDVGGRVTGKVGKYSLGLMNIDTRTDEVSQTPSTNFTVMRIRRDVLRRSTIGAIFTNRSASAVSNGSNQAYGVDGSFSFFENLNLGGYYARTETEQLSDDADSYEGRLDYLGDRYGARFSYLKIGDNFNPEVGLVRRDNFERSWGALRFSPRPARSKHVRKYTWEASLEYLVNGQDQLETRLQSGRFNIELQNSDQFTFEANDNYELLVRPFAIAPGVTIPPGGYNFRDANVSYAFGQQRPASGTLTLAFGQFYDGTIVTYTVSSARVALLQQFSVEPSVSINEVDLPAGQFTTTLLRARTDYGFSPRMFASALLQYNSTDRTFGSNLRFRWEYRPGSELFVVYTDEHDTLMAGGLPGLKNRAFVVKVNRLLRF
jgi:Domain of unknown function (DUF5916)